MSENQFVSSNDSRAFITVRRQGQRMTPEQRRAAQDIFLEAFALNCNVTASCVKANIDPGMISYWEKHDNHFAPRYQAAKQKADDMIRAAIWRRGIQGVPKYVTCAKGLVYEKVKDEKTGKMVSRPVMDTVYSDSLLAMLAKRLPEFKDQIPGVHTQTTVATDASGSSVIQVKTQWGSAPALAREDNTVDAAADKE